MPTEQTDIMPALHRAYQEIRSSQTSLASLVESVPGARVAYRPVTTVKFLRVKTELTLVRNDREIQVFECFFPEGDTKYMCGITIGHGRDVKTHYAPGQNRELLPDLIRKYTEPEPDTIPQQEVLQLRYLMASIGYILGRHKATLDAVPGGLRLRTGEPGKDSVAFNLVDKEAE
jgi:hypothetical protein